MEIAKELLGIMIEVAEAGISESKDDVEFYRMTEKVITLKEVLYQLEKLESDTAHIFSLDSNGSYGKIGYNELTNTNIPEKNNN